MRTRRTMTTLAGIALGLLTGVSCGDPPLCCLDLGEGDVRALTCDSDEAVDLCQLGDLSDCYYDPDRDDEC